MAGKDPRGVAGTSLERTAVSMSWLAALQSEHKYGIARYGIARNRIAAATVWDGGLQELCWSLVCDKPPPRIQHPNSIQSHCTHTSAWGKTPGQQRAYVDFTDQQCCCSDAGGDAHTIAENSVGRHTCRSMVTILLRIILLIVRHYSHHTLQWVSTCHTKCIAVDFKVVQKVPVM